MRAEETVDERPDWLTEPSPAWCDGEHADQQLEADRRHHSEYHVIPVIQQQKRWPRSGRAPGDNVEGAELNIVAFRDIGTRETWVAIANDRQHLEVTVESAARLHGALGGLLRQVAGEQVD